MQNATQIAQALTRIGFFVFPVLVTDNPENPWKKNKRPAIPMAHGKDDPLRNTCKGECGKLGHGFYDATNDPFYVEDLFAPYKNASVGVWTGKSGIVIADFDVKRSPEGEILVDGFDSFAQQWLEFPDTFSFDSVSGSGGRQYVYAAPDGLSLGPAGPYRGIQGLDRRGGGSYSVWNGEVPPSREVFAPAPEWLLDEQEERNFDRFTGTVQEWYATLEEGEPSLHVRAAMERTREVFESRGKDFDHGDMVARQHEAIRLGSEGHAGVPALLDYIEELFLSRTGDHSRPESEWNYEWAESLASGIQKHGAAIELRAELPAYSPSVVPGKIPDRLFLGAPGNKADFSALLRALQEETDDDLLVTSVLWNAPKTRELAREWGLEFVHSRVLSAREKPEPVKENPSLEERVIPKEETPHTFLSAEELERVKVTPTFIEVYDKATRSKGYTNPNYVAPAAWTALSMAMGRVAFIPLAKTLEMNLWMIVLGSSTTGKGTEDGFLRPVLNLTMADDSDTYYNLGALSSPDGLHQSLLERDGKASIIYNDEAADFFRDIRGGKDWMTTVPDKLSKWFDGYVEPSSKISLKDLKGKDARTSLNQMMWGTPDRMLELMDASQFQSGYLARVNWVWDTTQPDPDRKFDLKIQPDRVHDIPDDAYQVAADLRNANYVVNPRSGLNGTKKAQSRINKAANQFHAFARKSVRYEFFKPAVDRLVMETLWKLAGLLALYRGEHEFNLTDALTAIYYGSSWLQTLVKVAESISESPYSRDVEAMEKYVKSIGGSVTEAKLLHHFRGLIIRSRRELTDRIEFLVESGRFIVDRPNNVTTYKINGG